MSLLAACIQPNSGSYYFAKASGSGSSVLSSPTLIESTPENNAAYLRLTVDASGNSNITSAATSGNVTMTLGPVATTDDVLTLAVNPGSGVAFAEIGNTGGTTLNIAGSTSANGNCSIAASGSGTVTIGANATAYDNITLNNDHTVSLARAPVLAYGLAATTTLAQVDHGTNTVVSIPAGAQSPGLYCVLIQTATSNNISDATAHMSMTYYWNGTQIVAGGAVSGPTQVGGPAGAYSILPYAAAGVFNQLNFVNTTAGSAVVPTINWIKLAGPITGFP